MNRYIAFICSVAFVGLLVFPSQVSPASITETKAAIGKDCIAGKDYSTAMGHHTTASGYYSTAMGRYTTASGSFSTAMGNWTTASGNGSTAMGQGTAASGSFSTALGNYTAAGGSFSFAGGMYMQLTETADNTFVWGHATSPQSIETADAFLIFPVGTAGKVGIGTTSPATRLHVTENSNANTAHIVNTTSGYYNQSVLKAGRTQTSGGNLFAAVAGTDASGNGGTARMVVTTSGNVGIGNSAPGYLLQMESSGGYYSATDHQWHNGSSRAIKQDIKRNEMDILEILDSVEIVNYRYKTEVNEDRNAPYHIGFIAEDTHRLLSGKSRDGMAMGDCIGLLLAVVKEQQKTISELSEKISELENELNLR